MKTNSPGQGLKKGRLTAFLRPRPGARRLTGSLPPARAGGYSLSPFGLASYPFLPAIITCRDTKHLHAIYLDRRGREPSRFQLRIQSD